MTVKKSIWRRLLKWGFVLSALGIVFVGAALIVVYFKLSPKLPSIESLNHVQFQVPLRIYTTDGQLISEFGEKRREPVKLRQISNLLIQSFLAAEDDRFYTHPGVDYHGLIRAFVHLIRTGQRGQGGSTITMQLARNFFLTNKKTYERKFNEIMLALRIESELSKDEILELYLNKIYLGNRAYGVAAASRIYYGKDVLDLTLAEAAMIAGLPKAPSRYNPIVNPERALIRRNYVLRRMDELGYISTEQYQQTVGLPVTAELHYVRPQVEAGYIAEMVRARLHGLYGSRIYTAGLKVYTTVLAKNQIAANNALRKALVNYEKRHGFTLPIGRIEMEGAIDSSAREQWQLELSQFPEYGGLKAAVITEIDDSVANVMISNGSEAALKLADSIWARERVGKDKLGPKIKKLTDILSKGDVVYVESTVDDTVVTLSQMPQVEGALVSVQPDSGAILALVGGFDFYKSKFNRAVQARRQPGSNFKPFIYSTALKYGDTAATIYNDAPVVFHDSALEAEWRPENYSGRFYGPTRLREALVKSRNLVSIRVLRGLGLRRALDYVERFGFEIDKLPPDLSLALGSGSVTPLQLVNAYAVFANGGFLTSPHFISRVLDGGGQILFIAPEVVLCDENCAEEADNPPVLDLGVVDGGQAVDLFNAIADTTQTLESDPLEKTVEDNLQPMDIGNYQVSRVIDERNAFIMASILREVITRGTGKKARVLKRQDLAGKTGTTNDQHDAWFSGFNSQVATSVWVGFDELEPLGVKETGGKAALPMWIDYMAEALKNVPEDETIQPSKLVMVRIDKKTGQLSKGRNSHSMLEIFRREHAPTHIINSSSSNKSKKTQARVPVRTPNVEPAEQLF